ncbi:hypothetical protein [uncultured Methylobacterium sp.]|uniref:hypothetical protein n=1 Tax=uncultured Methylobacterium sp. TaxID=157278 RepID=UPI0035CA8473
MGDEGKASSAPKEAAKGRFSVETVSSLTQTLAIVGAGAWAVYTFIYEARIKPSLAPPAVSVTTNLVKAGERGDRVAIRSTVTRTNVGQTGVRILGLTYNVVGIKARFEEGGGRAGAFADTLPKASMVEQARGYTLSEAGDVILRQGLLFAGATDLPSAPSDLNPGEAVSRDLIVYADRSQFDSIRFKVSLAYGKSTDEAVPLRFETGPGAEIAMAPEADCRAEPEICRRLKTTDFATEFSLW